MHPYHIFTVLCMTNYDFSVQVTDKPILVYPNSGERYDADKKEWVVSSYYRN